MREFEDIIVEIESVGDLINTVSMLVRPIDTSINGQGAPTYDSIAGSFSAISDHIHRISADLQQYVPCVMMLKKENLITEGE